VFGDSQREAPSEVGATNRSFVSNVAGANREAWSRVPSRIPSSGGSDAPLAGQLQVWG